MTPGNDERLLERMRLGDEAAFVEIYRRHHAAIYRFAMHMCGSSAAAEDVTQEVFLILMRQVSHYDPARGALAGYLFGIARHGVYKRLAASRLEVPLDDEQEAERSAASPEPCDPFEGLSRAETVQRVRLAVRSLPPAYREVVILCELQETGYAAAASILGCPIGTVRSRLHRARLLLMTRLRAPHEATAGARSPV